MIKPVTPSDLTLHPARPEDLDELVALRIEAMRESLERIGRFDPERARERFRSVEEADAAGLPIRVGALRRSESNRFYLRHGFIQVEESEWDLYYERRR